MIGRSFLTASSAIDNGDNRIRALYLLEDKMGAIEEEVFKDDDALMNEQSYLTIDSKTFAYKAVLDKIKMGEDEDDLLNRVTLSAEWKEGSKSYDEILATYIAFPKKE